MMQAKQIRETALAIAADCEIDAAALDGKPFTAKVVAQMFGETLAMLQATAKLVAHIAALVEQVHGEAMQAANVASCLANGIKPD